jgi:hypothetical protein
VKDLLARRSRPPRLVVRTTVAMFTVVALVLSSVLILIAIQGSRYVRGTVADKLAAGQRMLSALEQRQSRELQAQLAMLAENPTLKAALDTYRAERAAPGAAQDGMLVATVRRELEKLAERLQPDVLAVEDPDGAVIAAAGHHAANWPASLPPPGRSRATQVVTRPSGVYQRVSAPITIGDVELGTLELATALDQEYARSRIRNCKYSLSHFFGSSYCWCPCVIVDSNCCNCLTTICLLAVHSYFIPIFAKHIVGGACICCTA